MLRTETTTPVRKRKSEREFDKELVALIVGLIEGGATQQEIATALQKAIEGDDDLVLYLTRPKLPGVLYERVGELLRSSTGRMRRQLVRLVSAQSSTPNHMPPEEFRETVKHLLLGQYFAGKQLQDWTYGSIRDWGALQRKKGESMVKWGQVAIAIGGLGPDGSTIDVIKNESKILKILKDLKLSVKELPAA